MKKGVMKMQTDLTAIGKITRFSESGGGYQIDTQPDVWFNLGYSSWDNETKTGTPKPFIPVEKNESVKITYTENQSGKKYIKTLEKVSDAKESNSVNEPLLRNHDIESRATQIDTKSLLIIRQTCIKSACDLLSNRASLESYAELAENVIQLSEIFEKHIKR